MWNISLKMFFPCFGLALWLGLLAPAAGQTQERDKDMAARGHYIFAVAGGCACHTVPKEPPHAGGRAFPIPIGKAYATNIAQDKETGIGSWSDKEIRDSIEIGRAH